MTANAGRIQSEKRAMLHSLTLHALLEEHRRSRPDHIAAISEGRQLSYPQLADRVIRLANALQDAGVTRGDRILWLAQNDIGALEGQRMRDGNFFARRGVEPFVHAPEMRGAEVKAQFIDQPRHQRQLLGRPDGPADADRIVLR